MANSTFTSNDSQQAVLDLLAKQKLVENLVEKQDMPRHDLVQQMVKKQNLATLQRILNHLHETEVAQILENLPPEDQLFLWDQLDDERKEPILLEASLSVLQNLSVRDYKTERSRVKAFGLKDGQFFEIAITKRDDLTKNTPIWIDLVAPTFEDRIWVGDIFDIEFPDPNKLDDLESSARFYLEENGEIHLHSDFLRDKNNSSDNISVAFILYKDILFSIRNQELPIFRLERLRALNQPHYVSNAKDVLLDLYAANVEHSADVLEDIYRSLETVGNQVLGKQMSDEEAASVLTDISYKEDLNGRIRRNVMDTRRAVSFLIHCKLLDKEQLENCQQILADIKSLDGHTAFLFDKINFLMDATVGFININQNKVVKKISIISVIFMPLNVIAGIGGMSEFSMMTNGIPWPIAYAGLLVGLGAVGWITFLLIRYFENRNFPV